MNTRILNEKEKKLLVHFESKKHCMTPEPMKNFGIIKKNTHFTIANPIAYKIDDSDTYLVFGEFTGSFDIQKLQEQYLKKLKEEEQEKMKEDNKNTIPTNIHDFIENEDEDTKNEEDSVLEDDHEEKNPIYHSHVRNVDDEDKKPRYLDEGDASDPHEEDQTLFRFDEDLIKDEDVQYLVKTFKIHKNQAIRSLVDNNYELSLCIEELTKEKENNLN